ncbi:MAG: hypothetical protein LBN21_07620 [Treponema sp.]|jgi:hypothetical protein|nr:hypothetical protein [Treponema sp.]
MRPIDHFFSQLERLEQSLRPGEVPDKKTLDYLEKDFSALAGPVLGPQEAAGIFDRTRERITVKPDQKFPLHRFGALAAFFLGEFNIDSMELANDDWDDVQETLKELSGEIHLDTLTALMQELMNLGKLN